MAEVTTANKLVINVMTKEVHKEMTKRGLTKEDELYSIIDDEEAVESLTNSDIENILQNFAE